jgi:xanthine dehydrogenase accessory factor
MSVHVLSWALDEVKQGHRVAIATIISAKGSVPGKPGAKLAINSKIQKFGTVGGAGLELKIEKKLILLLNEDNKVNQKKGGLIETFYLYKDAKGKEGIALDSLCGDY